MIFSPPYPDGLPVGAGVQTWAPCPQTSVIAFPYDGTEVASAPVGSADHAETAVAEAASAFAVTSRLGTGTRRALLMDIHAALSREATALAGLLVLETGKPLVDCRTEVQRTLTTWSAAAEETARIHGETVPLDLQPQGEGMLGYFTRRPAGVVVGIAGFNYPLLLASHKLAPAIAAGCPVIIKPSPDTPLTTLWAVHLIRTVLEAHGVTPAAVQLVTGGPEVGAALVEDPRVAVVSFTGSAAVGHRIAKAAAPRRTVLELGSNTGLIVAEDAVLDDAVDAVIRGGFYANGQACISVQRVVLAEPIADEFERRLLARLPEVVVGDPRAESTRLAPLINSAAADRVLAWIKEAVSAGARLVAGGSAVDGRSISPTVLADVPRSCSAWSEEVFGPVVCLERVSGMTDAINAVNESRYGLQAAVYTASLQHAFQAIEQLDVGGVVVNEIPGFRSDIMPYGGVKDSGIGREGPRFAIEEFTVTRMAMIRP